MPRQPPSSKVSMDAASFIFSLYHKLTFQKLIEKTTKMAIQKQRGIKILEYQKRRHIRNSESVREPSPTHWTTKIQHCLVPNLYFLLILFRNYRKSHKIENFEFPYFSWLGSPWDNYSTYSSGPIYSPLGG